MNRTSKNLYFAIEKAAWSDSLANRFDKAMQDSPPYARAYDSHVPI